MGRNYSYAKMHISAINVNTITIIQKPQDSPQLKVSKSTMKSQNFLIQLGTSLSILMNSSMRTIINIQKEIINNTNLTAIATKAGANKPRINLCINRVFVINKMCLLF